MAECAELEFDILDIFGPDIWPRKGELKLFDLFLFFIKTEIFNEYSTQKFEKLLLECSEDEGVTQVTWVKC